MNTNYETPELREFGKFQELTQITFDGQYNDSPTALNGVNSPQATWTSVTPQVVEK